MKWQLRMKKHLKLKSLMSYRQ
ncbi:hypothetical protein P004_02951, partial [Enterococcus faecalis EnGen0404]